MAKEEWNVEVYLEPGEAWALNAGFLLTSVLDVLKNGETQIAILDVSAACHMPDVLEMPYCPPLLDADEMGEDGITVRLGGPTCLSGDVIGDTNSDSCPNMEIFSCLVIWLSIPHARIIHLMECHCRISGLDVLTAQCCRLQILVMQILKEDLEVRAGNDFKGKSVQCILAGFRVMI